MSSRPWDRKRAKRNRANREGSYVIRFRNGSSIVVPSRLRTSTLMSSRDEMLVEALSGTGKTRSLARAIGINIPEDV